MIDDNKQKILGIIGLSSIAYYLFTSKTISGATGSLSISEEQARQLWRQTGETLWEGVNKKLKEVKIKIDQATIRVALEDLQNPKYKEYFCRTSTTTQLLIVNFWQVSFGVDFSPLLKEFQPKLDDFIQRFIGSTAVQSVWNIASGGVALATLSALAYSTPVKTALSQITLPALAKGGYAVPLKTFFSQIPGIGLVIAIATFFLPTPQFIQDLFKPKITGKIVIPFPSNSLKILKYLTAQNAEYLYMTSDFMAKDTGLYTLQRLIDLQEYKEPLSTPFYINKFVEGCKLAGWTSIYDKIRDINYAIKVVNSFNPAFDMPFNITFDTGFIPLDDSLASEIIVVGSDRYKQLWEKMTGRKFNETIILPVDVVLSRKISPDTMLPTYTDLLYQLPYKPLVAFPDYPYKALIVCPACNGTGYIVSKSSGILGINSEIKLKTCGRCNGFGFIFVGA